MAVRELDPFTVCTQDIIPSVPWTSRFYSPEMNQTKYYNSRTPFQKARIQYETKDAPFLIPQQIHLNLQDKTNYRSNEVIRLRCDHMDACMAKAFFLHLMKTSSSFSLPPSWRLSPRMLSSKMGKSKTLVSFS